MGIKKSLLVGMLAAAVLTPGCNAKENRSAHTYVEREILDVAVPIVVSSANNGPATATDKDVRISDNPELHAVIQARDRIDNKIYFSDLSAALIGGKRIQKPFTDGWELPMLEWDQSRYGPIEIKWFEIRAENGFYNNTIPSQSHIKYIEVPAGSGWALKPGLGTHRYKILVNYAGRQFGNANEMNVSRGGQINGVHRISVREDDDLPGQMTAWEDTPYIYGSSDDQVEMYVGGDCADIITGALHRMGRKDIPYTYSQGFGRFGDVVFRGYINMQGHFLDKNKKEADKLDVKRGDLLVYKAPQHHVAVFYKGMDKSGDAIEVVHSYDEKGVHKDILYSGHALQPGALFKYFSNMLGKNPDTKTQKSVDKRLDTVEVIRLR